VLTAQALPYAAAVATAWIAARSTGAERAVQPVPRAVPTPVVGVRAAA